MAWKVKVGNVKGCREAIETHSRYAGRRLFLDGPGETTSSLTTGTGETGDRGPGLLHMVSVYHWILT
jgi:hypothetical protein